MKQDSRLHTLDRTLDRVLAYRPDRRTTLAQVVAGAAAPLQFYEFFAGGGMARIGLGSGWSCRFANDIDESKASAYQSGGMRMAKAAGNTPSPKARAQVLHTLGFGVPATSDPHHFKVVIPKASTGKVQISEHLGLQSASNDNAVIDRVLLDRPRWTAIRAEVQRAFNARLAAHGIKPGTWKVGDNPVDRLLGKELCVLAWAVEQMEMEKIPVAMRNWLALRPEERWWLFGMTAMSTGGVMDAGKGWRAALKHALGDVAQSELLAPRARRGKPEQEVAQASLGLFGDEAP